MSTAPRHRTSWVGQVYDKLILIVMLIALVGSASFLLIQIGGQRAELSAARWEQPWVEPKVVAPVDLAAYDEARQMLVAPAHSTVISNAMMISELRVSCIECEKPIEFYAEVCPFCGTEQPKIFDTDDLDSDGDQITDLDERKLGMDPFDATDATQDMDQDGFTNIEEFQSDSDPRDAESFPSPIAKLRILRLSRKPFKLRFQGAAQLTGGSVRYQLNLRSLERTYFAQIGDEIEGIIVEEYLADAPEGQTLVVKQGEERIPLVKGKAYTKFELTADIVFLIDRKPYRLRVGDVFDVRDREYKVIDIRRDGVLIRDEKTGKETLVGKLSEQEKDLLRSGGNSSVQQDSAGLNASQGYQQR